MKKIFLLLLPMLAAAGGASAQVPENPGEDFVIASVMIASPKDALYSCTGHAFLRMQCPSHGMDYCFTYESENADDHLMRFFKGDLMMGMDGMKTEEFLKHYSEQGRGVKEYRLMLPIAAKQKLWQVLDKQVAQGMYLPYDFMERGCSITILHAIEQAAGYGKIVITDLPPEFNHTRRDIFCSQIDNYPWYRTFLNIVGNGSVDYDVEPKEKAITPMLLIEALQHATLDGKPILEEPIEVLPETAPASKPSPVTPMMVAMAVLALSLICAFAGKTWMLYILIAVQTAIGILTIYLVFFSSLCATEWSWLIIPFNPLPLILWKWRGSWEIWYAAAIILWSAIMWLGGHYLTDPPLILLAVSVAVAYGGDYAARRGYKFHLNLKRLLTNNKSSLKPI